MRLIKICALLLFLLSFSSCFKKKSTSSPSEMKVSSYDLAFDVEKLESEPGEEVRFKLFNGLQDEKLKFYLLKQGEDPILVQHLKIQQGEVPADYFIYSSQDIEPNTKLDVNFKAPQEEGVYAFVGVSDFPRETLVGHLVVKKKEEQETVDKKISGEIN